MNKATLIILLSWFGGLLTVAGQDTGVWVADQGDGTYLNPILHADYSDPDVCRAGDDFYMTASSFNAVPGLPVLHSKDLVNWQLIGHALPRLQPEDHFSKPQHGNGVWAPSIRYHNGEFYVYWGDPDFGIYMVKTENPAGPWSEPVLVLEGKGLIDPCPIWTTDGNAYLVHAFAGSRAGIKSVLVVHEMATDGTHLTDPGVIVFDGHDDHPTVEGPKFYERDGYYYIFAPAGGVKTGWQLALRSRNILGPYEEKIVMAQEDTDINGPHQGGWVSLPSGEDWFIHFQDKGAYGRIVHLQPVQWTDGWPVIGSDPDGDGTGKPVAGGKKPAVNGTIPAITPPESDEFNGPSPGLQWQWHANPGPTFAFSYPGYFRLYTQHEPGTNLWESPNLFLQKFPAEAFSATAKLRFHPGNPGDRAGLVIMGSDYASLAVESREDGVFLVYSSVPDAPSGNPESGKVIAKAEASELFLRVEVDEGAVCRFSFSFDGEKFIRAGETFQAAPGKWIGAKVGLFALQRGVTNDAGYADVDWFRIEPLIK